LQAVFTIDGFSAFNKEIIMEADNELRLEALRLAIGRNNKIVKQDGTIFTVDVAEVAKEASVLFKFLKGE